MKTLDQCTDISGGVKMSPFYVSGEPTSAFDVRPMNINAPFVDDCRLYIVEWSEGSTMIMAACMPRAAGTSSAWLNRPWKSNIDKINSTSSSPTARTSSPPHADPKTTSKAILELHRISGLDWDELAQLFDVSRDTIHSWASRKPLDADKEKQIMDALDVVRYVDRGTSRATRKALHGTDESTGKSPFELLAEQRFDEASEALGKGTPLYRPKLGELSQESKDARKPLPLEVLVNARHDRIHNDTGRTRVVRGVRNKRRDGT